MLEPSASQAAGLRGLSANKPIKVIAVASGKGGVGKTNIAINLAIGLAQRGRSTMLLDADLGLANIDVLLGLQPVANLAQVLDGQLELQDIVIEGPAGVKVVPAASGVSELAQLAPRQYAGLIDAFATLPFDIDAMVVDTASGIHDAVTGMCQAADEVVVVVCDEPGSITDAYALIKVLSRERGVNQVRLLSNNVRNSAHGEWLFQVMLRACDRFLDVSLSYCGMIPHDDALRRAVRRQCAVVECYPGSPAGRAFKELARRADNWSVPSRRSGQPAFFLERQLRCFAGSGVGVSAQHVCT